MGIYDEIRDLLESHLEKQPYRVRDDEGNELDAETSVDSDGDLLITIDLSDLHAEISNLQIQIDDLQAQLEELEEDND